MIDVNHPNYLNTPASSERAVYKYELANHEASPILSIITPYYNTGAVFLETAKTVLAQSLQQWEWVIVNDGSTNSEALAVLDRFRNVDPRIKVVDQVNAGLAGARNTGIRETHAPFIFFLDSDDLLEPTALEILLWKVCTDERLSFATSYLIGFGAQEYIWKNGFNTTNRFLQENMVSVMAIVRREVVEKVGLFDIQREIATEDYDFWLRCASLGFWGADVPLPLVWYRRRPINANGDIRDQQQRYSVFHQEMRRKYAGLFARGMPEPILSDPTKHIAYAKIPSQILWLNRLRVPQNSRRILIIVPWMNVGGADQFNLSLIDQLLSLGWDISVCSTLAADNTWLSEFTQRTPDVFILSAFLKRVDFVRFICYIIQSRQIQTVLITNSELAYHMLPYLRVNCPGTIFVDYIHMEEEYWRNGGYPRMSIVHKPFIDQTIVSSHHLKQWMVEQGGSEQHIEVCPTNIDTCLWKPDPDTRRRVRQELALSEDTTLILYAGRLTHQKQPRLFAEVMLCLSQQPLPSFTVVVAGDGPEKAFLEEFVKSHKLSQVQLLGYASNRRIKDLLNAADIFFLPSQMEGISVAIYEAMSMGIVSVGADVGGQSELVTETCGFLIKRDAQEREHYVGVLRELITNPAKRKKMGNAARERIITHYDIKSLGIKIENIINQAHQSRKQTALSLDEAQSFVTISAELLRIVDSFDYIWYEKNQLQERYDALHHEMLLQHGAYGRAYKERLERSSWKLRAKLWPAYSWALSHGMGWLKPLKFHIYTFVKRVLNRI